MHCGETAGWVELPFGAEIGLGQFHSKFCLLYDKRNAAMRFVV